MGAVMPGACFRGAEPVRSHPTEEYRIVLAGGAKAGKSTILRSICLNQRAVDYTPTLHVEVGVKTIEINDEAVVTLHLWDSPGAPQVDLSELMYDRASGVMLVFDVSDTESYLSLPEMIQNARKYLPKGVPILLCANKCDMENRAVTTERLICLVKEHFLCGVVEMTASTGDGVRIALKHIVREVRAKSKEHQLQLAVAWHPNGVNIGASCFGAPLSENIELERSRGLQASLPLVIELSTQALKQLEYQDAFTIVDDTDKKRVAKYVEYLIVLYEQDLHGVILEIKSCHDARVIAQWLLSYIRKLPETIVPAAVYSAYMKACSANDGQTPKEARLRASAMVASMGAVEKEILHALASFLNQYAAQQSAILALEPLICGGYDEDVNKSIQDTMVYPNGVLLHLIADCNDSILW